MIHMFFYARTKCRQNFDEPHRAKVTQLNEKDAIGKSDKLEGMELRHLRYFRAVAENRRFSRGARLLHVSHPLSAGVADLEREVGVRC